MVLSVASFMNCVSHLAWLPAPRDPRPPIEIWSGSSFGVRPSLWLDLPIDQIQLTVKSISAMSSGPIT